MGDKELEKETLEPLENKETEVPSPETKEVGKGAFSKIQREIKDSDLKNPAVGRLLLDERDRLLGDKAIGETFREKYYEADRRASVTETQLSSKDNFDKLYTLGLAIGGILLGAAFVVTDLTLRIILGGCGIVLMGGSVYISYKK